MPNQPQKSQSRGGSAKISDAGTGWGYYIACENAVTAKPTCMIGETRRSGWAYNVMDLWNKLHASRPAGNDELIREMVKALKPFASVANHVLAEAPAEATEFTIFIDCEGCKHLVTLNAFRNAVSALARAEEAGIGGDQP